MTKAVNFSINKLQHNRISNQVNEKLIRLLHWFRRNDLELKTSILSQILSHSKMVGHKIVTVGIIGIIVFSRNRTKLNTVQTKNIKLSTK